MTYVSPLSSGEQDIIEDILGPGEFFLLHKLWEERRQLIRERRSIWGTIKFCREEGRRELHYHEYKRGEVELREYHMNARITKIILSLEKKVEPEFYERILKLSDPGNKIGEKPEEGPLY